MIQSRNLKIALFATGVGFLSLLAPDRLSTSTSYQFTSTAEARVGRPMTPVSVAGVARRSVRRCAVGVYNC